MIAPFFSIITPIYNGEKFIYRFYNSLISQDFSNWECLLIDDCSIDKSKIILEEICLKDKRFSLFSTNNYSIGRLRTPSFARNIGLKNARGDFLCFLDIDDFWLKDKLRNDFEAIKSNTNIDLFISNYFVYNINTKDSYLKPRLKFINLKIQSYFWNPVPMLTVAVRRKIVRNITFQEINHEDYIFWFNVLKSIKTDSIKELKHASSVYVSNRTSLSSNKLKVLSWWIKCFKMIGHNILICYFLLLVKIFSTFIELLLNKLDVFSKLKNIDNVLEKNEFQTNN